MRAAAYQGIGDIAVVEREMCGLPTGWVRLRVTSAGVCGSDLHVLGGALGDPAGMQPGHEIAGVVEAVGDGASVAPGSHVAVEPIVACGDCVHCRALRPNLCSKGEMIGFGLPGGLAEYVDVPEETLHELPAELSTSAAGLSEPMAVGVRGARIGQIGPGDRVGIVGAGTIGLLSIVTAKEAGAAEAVIAARHSHQQELARSLGADKVCATSEELIDAVGPEHLDVVVETVGGDADTLAEAVAMVRRGGRIVVVGVFTGVVALPGMPFFVKELTVAASNCYARDLCGSDFSRGVELVASHAALIEPLVTHTFALDDVAAAFSESGDKATRAVKIHIRPLG